MQVTTEQLTATLELDKMPTYQFICFLEAAGIVTRIGSEPPATGKGRGKIIYHVPDDLPEQLKTWLKVRMG